MIDAHHLPLMLLLQLLAFTTVLLTACLQMFIFFTYRTNVLTVYWKVQYPTTVIIYWYCYKPAY